MVIVPDTFAGGEVKLIETFNTLRKRSGVTTEGVVEFAGSELTRQHCWIRVASSGRHIWNVASVAMPATSAPFSPAQGVPLFFALTGETSGPAGPGAAIGTIRCTVSPAGVPAIAVSPVNVSVQPETALTEKSFGVARPPPATSTISPTLKRGICTSVPPTVAEAVSVPSAFIAAG